MSIDKNITMLNFLKPFYPIFFAVVNNSPEYVHNQTIKTLQNIEKKRDSIGSKWLIRQMEETFCSYDSALSQSLWNLKFTNPLGLAPGFDKNAQGAGIWSSFGFGFAELGAVTLHPQQGNPLPRMFRLPEDKAILNRMGANNDGAKNIASRLEQIWFRQKRAIPIGINLCKSKITDLSDAADDYVNSFKYLRGWADYFVVNVSSPNTPGLRSLQAGNQLKPILEALTKENQGEKPILIKIAPDLEWQEISSILQISGDYNLSGVIATNTTITREGLKTKILPATRKPITEENGGISGLPLRQRSTEIIRFIYQETKGQLPIIGVGGISDTESAWEKIIAGATLLQFYSGWIYEGPWVVPEILQGLKRKLEENGLNHIEQAIGMEHN